MEVKSTHSNGKNWVYRLKGGEKGPGLLDLLDDEAKVTALIVCFVNAQDIRHYTKFDNFIECIHVMLNVAEDKRCFHEVVLEHRNQKMRFDVDIKKTPDVSDEEVQMFMDELIETTINVYNELGYQLIPQKHILLFSSHGPSKWSYHIIIDGFYCENCNEALALFKKITEKMKSKERVSDWLDASIYNPNHSLRILSSVKSGRKKILEKVWKFKNEQICFEFSQKPRNDKHQIVLEFERSFISLTENCFPIPQLVVKDQSYKNQSCVLNDDVSDFAFRLFKSVYGNVFSHVKTVSNFVLLQRVSESGCPVCNRVHESENAFLVVKTNPKENGMTKHEIYFYCRRSTGNKVLVGEKIEMDEQEKQVIIENKPNVRFQLKDLEHVSKTRREKIFNK